MALIDWVQENLLLKNMLARQFLGEFLGTMILLQVGLSAAVSFNIQLHDFELRKGDSLGLVLCFIGASLIGGMLCIRISGGMLNPAFTFAAWTTGGLEWFRVGWFMLAQYLGAFIGSAVMYNTYYLAISNHHDKIGGRNDNDATRMALKGRERTREDSVFLQYLGKGSEFSTAGFFATYPNGEQPLWSSFSSEMTATIIMAFAAATLTDSLGMAAPHFMLPFYFLFSVAMTSSTFSLITSGSLNAARDLGPRFFQFLAGWKTAFDDNNGWYPWVTGVFSCHIGVTIGIWLHRMIIGYHRPAQGDDWEAQHKICMKCLEIPCTCRDTGDVRYLHEPIKMQYNDGGAQVKSKGSSDTTSTSK